MPEVDDGFWDVVVVGGGNAAIVSAMSAEELGARVLLLERAPRHMRGGNTRHTRNIRCVHAADDYNSGEYRLRGTVEGPVQRRRRTERTKKSPA